VTRWIIGIDGPMPPELVNIQLMIADFSAYVVFAQHSSPVRALNGKGRTLTR